jgi:hypothetical protein
MNQSAGSGKINMEHRWGGRRRLLLRVRICGSRQAAALGWLTDVSLSGAYVRTTARLTIMSLIYIQLDERDDGGPELQPLQLPARVVRHGPTGIGLEWQEFASAMLAQIVGTAPDFALVALIGPTTPNETGLLES